MNTVPHPLNSFGPQVNESAPHASTSDFPATANNDRLSDWLHTSRDLLWELMSRKRLLERLHPQKNLADDEAKLLESEVAEIENDLVGLCTRLADIENTEPFLGSRVLIGANPPDGFRAVVAVLVLSRLWCAYDWEFDIVGLICELISGGNPDKALAIRNSFRAGGALRPHVNIERRTNNIDHWRVGLTESALATALGQTPDMEQIAASVYREFHDTRRKGV